MAARHITIGQYVNRRGRMYRCLRCKEYCGEKTRVTEHIYSKHVALDSVPFYCAICKFTCAKQIDLERHVKNYSKHRVMVFEMRRNGQVVNEEASLMANQNPYQIVSTDMERMNRQESQDMFQQRSTKATLTAQSDILPDNVLQRAMLETGLVPREEDILPGLLNMSGPGYTPMSGGQSPLSAVAAPVHPMAASPIQSATIQSPVYPPTAPQKEYSTAAELSSPPATSILPLTIENITRHSIGKGKLLNQSKSRESNSSSSSSSTCSNYLKMDKLADIITGLNRTMGVAVESIKNGLDGMKVACNDVDQALAQQTQMYSDMKTTMEKFLEREEKKDGNSDRKRAEKKDGSDENRENDERRNGKKEKKKDDRTEKGREEKGGRSDKGKIRDERLERKDSIRRGDRREMRDEREEERSAKRARSAEGKREERIERDQKRR